jgi:peptide/nickel transport system substrate-binding protein
VCVGFNVLSFGAIAQLRFAVQRHLWRPELEAPHRRQKTLFRERSSRWGDPVDDDRATVKVRSIMADQQISELVDRLASGQISRRQFLQRAIVAGLGASAIANALNEHASAAPGAHPHAIAYASQVDDKTLVIADDLKDQWITLDPGWIYEINSQAAENVVYEPLYTILDSTKPQDISPLLADGMPEFSADGLSATVKLRQGVKFQNTGNVMTADDVVFSWTRTKNIKWQAAFLATDYWDKVEAVDPQTIKITLKAQNAALVPILTTAPLGVIDSVFAKENGATDAEDADKTDTFKDWTDANTSVGTGPFIQTAFDINGEVTIERNPDYWGDAPALDRVIFRNIVVPTEQTEAVISGEADIAYSVDPDQLADIRTNPDLQVLTGPTLAIDYIAMHVKDEPGGPLAKKEMRQAIAYAIDYDGFVNDLMKGDAVRPATIVPLGLQGADEVKDLAYVKDLTKAQQLFDSTGVGQTELTFTYGAGASTNGGIPLETVAAKLQSDLQQINGLTIKLNPMDPAKRLEDYRAGKLQFTVSGWTPDFADVSSYSDPFGASTGSAAKRVGFSDPALDALLAQGIAELDPEKRTAIYVEVQKQLIDAAAFIVLVQPNDRKPASKSVQGVTTHSIVQIQLRGASKTASS